jgi:hypothetical protein
VRSISSLFKPITRSLAQQIDRLRDTIDDLSIRLRESVGHAVGQAVAGTVREAFRAIAIDSEVPSNVRYGPRQSDERSSLIWNDGGQSEPEDWYGEYQHAMPDDQDDDLEPPIEPLSESEQASPAHSALATGLRVAAWSLQRFGPCNVATALGAGLLATIATYTGGPLIAASAGVLSSFISLLSIEGSIRAGANNLVALASR